MVNCNIPGESCGKFHSSYLSRFRSIDGANKALHLCIMEIQTRLRVSVCLIIRVVRKVLIISGRGVRRRGLAVTSFQIFPFQFSVAAGPEAPRFNNAQHRA